MTGTDDPGPRRRPRAPKASKATEASKARTASKASKAEAGAAEVSGTSSDRTGPGAPSPTSPEALAVWLAGRRWFGGGAAEISLATVALPTEPALAIGLVDTGDGRRHQLLVPAEPADRADVADDPVAADQLARWVAQGGTTAATDLGRVRAHWLRPAAAIGEAPARPFGGEQSNTSVVVGGTHVVKLLRRLQPGIHPEVEVGRHLAAVADAEPTLELPVARLAGWYELSAPQQPGGADEPTTLGVVQELVPGALDAWALVLSALAGDAGALLARLRLLGVSLARLHGALARPAEGSVPDDGPGSFGVVALTGSRIDEVVAGVSADARRVLGPDPTGSDPAGSEPLASVAGRGDEVAALAERLATRVGSDLGSAIRHHGDLHLGQVVDTHAGWVVLDFEGEPSRPLAERRLRHSPLRDVAGMLRSFAYAAATHRRAEGHRFAPGWEPAARAAFLDGYLATVEPALLPTSPVATRTLLTLLELEKVVYEIHYELDHRPDWVGLPVAGLARLLDAGNA